MTPIRAAGWAGGDSGPSVGMGHAASRGCRLAAKRPSRRCGAPVGKDVDRVDYEDYH